MMPDRDELHRRFAAKGMQDHVRWLTQALKTGDPLDLMRARAEVLLDPRFAPTLIRQPTEAEREELGRIAVAPRASDRAFLAQFDLLYRDDD